VKALATERICPSRRPWAVMQYETILRGRRVKSGRSDSQDRISLAVICGHWRKPLWRWAPRTLRLLSQEGFAVSALRRKERARARIETRRRESFFWPGTSQDRTGLELSSSPAEAALAQGPESEGSDARRDSPQPPSVGRSGGMRQGESLFRVVALSWEEFTVGGAQVRRTLKAPTPEGIRPRRLPERNRRICPVASA
jgi:hypothetical protein